MVGWLDRLEGVGWVSWLGMDWGSGLDDRLRG